MGQESTREALIDDLWRLVKTNGFGARERTGEVLDELERRGLLKLWRWRCDRCLQFTDRGGGHGPGFCIDRRPVTILEPGDVFDPKSYCEDQGHEYLVGDMTCVVCGHEWSCAEDGHYTPDLLTLPDCLVCGAAIT